MLKQKLLAITLSSLILSTTSLGFAQSHQPTPSAQFVTTAKPTVWSVAASKKAQSLNTLNLPNSQELDDTVLANTDGQFYDRYWQMGIAAVQKGQEIYRASEPYVRAAWTTIGTLSTGHWVCQQIKACK